MTSYDLDMMSRYAQLIIIRCQDEKYPEDTSRETFDMLGNYLYAMKQEISDRLLKIIRQSEELYESGQLLNGKVEYQEKERNKLIQEIFDGQVSFDTSHITFADDIMDAYVFNAPLKLIFAKARAEQV